MRRPKRREHAGPNGLADRDAEVLAINGPSFRLKGRLDALRARPDDAGPA